MSVFSAASVVTMRETFDQTRKLREAVESSKFNSETVIYCVLKVSGQVNFEEIPYTPEAINKAVAACFKEKEESLIPTPFPTQPPTTVAP